MKRPISFRHIEVNKSDKLKESTPSRQIDNIVIMGGVTIKKESFDNTKFTYWRERVDKAAANKSV